MHRAIIPNKELSPNVNSAKVKNSVLYGDKSYGGKEQRKVIRGGQGRADGGRRIVQGRIQQEYDICTSS